MVSLIYFNSMFCHVKWATGLPGDGHSQAVEALRPTRFHLIQLFFSFPRASVGMPSGRASVPVPQRRRVAHRIPTLARGNEIKGCVGRTRPYYSFGNEQTRLTPWRQVSYSHFPAVYAFRTVSFCRSGAIIEFICSSDNSP